LIYFVDLFPHVFNE